MQKKITLLFMAGLMVAALAGCDKQEAQKNPAPTQAPASEEPQPAPSLKPIEPIGPTEPQPNEPQPNNPQPNNPQPNNPQPNNRGVDYSIYQDPEQHILDQWADTEAPVPELYITGDAWMFSQDEIAGIWKKNYPYMTVVFGPIADDFWEQGITYNMTHETLTHEINEQYPNDNRIDMGESRTQNDIHKCSTCLVHEAGHLWLQNLNESITYAHGQWIWEAQSILYERIAQAENFDPENRDGRQVGANFDLMDYIGADALNGTWSDGNMIMRSRADMPGSFALYYLDTILSTPGTYDYWYNVGVERTKYAVEHNIEFTEPKVVKKIMDDVAGGKTIDGMKPSEWLFSRAVSCIDAPDGDYLLVYFDNNGMKYGPDDTEVGSNFGKDFRVTINAYNRKNGVETAYTDQEVNTKIYDAHGNVKFERNMKLGPDGTINKEEVREDGKYSDPRDFDEYSALRVVATTTINGKELSDTNFTICLNDYDKVDFTDNRMFFILINEDETINCDLTDVEVTGGYNVDKSHLKDGLLIVQVNQGEDVTVFGKTYSKPCGARTIPLVVE